MRWTTFKHRRVELNQLQVDVAHRAGINASRLSLIENGHVMPRPDELERIAAALGLSVEVLVPPVTTEAAA